ncbi:DNA gyrase subunit A [Candidatus Woesearchaeota archaeon]|nr:DNA gyrase subunit A [Candidatus Woesearchaeota archaeon]
MAEKISKRVIEAEMKESYLDYAMSVIVGRALPDVRDGLKPVHRRVLFSMHQMGMHFNKPFRKSARIVGDCLGKYHQHGDTAVYDTLVRMAQDFSLRYPLVEGQGNFGSIDGDNAAAMRYTEARLSKIAGEMLEDIDKETVKFVPNFDNSLQEPLVLPSKLPNLLVNGSSGIAVGMATNIPPHNLTEVADAIVAQIDDKEITVAELMQHLKGPDFPTGGIIMGKAGIRSAYSTGIGHITVRAAASFEESRGRAAIIIYEIPYMVNKSMLVEQIAECIKSGTVNGIADLRDESDRQGMRIVIELKKDANRDVVLNQLFKHTRLQTTFGINMLALVNNEPCTLDIKQLIQHFVEHRQLVIRRRTTFELKKAEERAHLLDGLLIALKNIDNVIALIKKSKSTDTAREALVVKYELSEVQAKAILEMRLQRLTALEQAKIKDELKELLERIRQLKTILASELEILKIIKQELIELKKSYGDERRSKIEEEEEELIEEDLIKEEPAVITVTNSGYIKRTNPAFYKKQNRGGKGVIAATTREEDFVEHLFIASTHSYILFFTNKGKVYWLKVYQLPEASRQAKGKAIVNLLQLSGDEQVTAMIPVREFDNRKLLVMATKKGVVNKTMLEEFSRPRKGGIIAINLDSDDMLIDVVMTDGTKQIMIATKRGYAIRFSEEDIRATGRSTRGVRGIMLRKGDEVVGMVICDKTKNILTVTENGYGKQTPMEDYRLIGRGGKGVINIICSPRNGSVVDVKSVSPEDEIMLISKQGILIRVPVKSISTIGRNTQGVRLMRLNQGDKVMSAAKIAVD